MTTAPDDGPHDPVAHARAVFADIQALVADQGENLTLFAAAAVDLGLTGDTAILFLIAVDSRWKPLIDYMAPGRDWSTVRAQGGVTLAGGVALREDLVVLLSEVLPVTAPTLARAAAPGAFHALLLLDHAQAIAEVRAPQGAQRQRRRTLVSSLGADVDRMTDAQLEDAVEGLLSVDPPLPPHPGLKRAAVPRTLAAFLRLTGNRQNVSPSEIAKAAKVHLRTVADVHRWARVCGLVG